MNYDPTPTWTNPISPVFHEVFITALAMVSFVGNGSLIVIILRTTNKQIGAYKWIFFAFSCSNIISSLFYLVMLPCIHLGSFGYVFFGRRLIAVSSTTGVALTTAFVCTFYQTFVLLAFHYIYRYVVLCHGVPSLTNRLIQYAYENPLTFCLPLAITVNLFYFGLYIALMLYGYHPNDWVSRSFQPELILYYNFDPFGPTRPGYLGLSYKYVSSSTGNVVWKASSIVTNASVCSIFAMTAIAITWCLSRIKRAMSYSAFKLSPKTIQMQRSLLRALVIQTLVPCALSYFPLSFVFVIPLTGIPVGGWGNVVLMLTAIFPSIDPFLVVTFVAGYRQSVPLPIRRFLETNSTSDLIKSTMPTRNI